MMSVAKSAVDTRELILEELQRCLEAVLVTEIAEAQVAILNARRVFTVGAGRSGLALKMAAMRLMHLGLTVHVVGEVTTPAISTGDLLIIASGSGTTAGAVHAAEVAKKAGAKLLAITTSSQSPLGILADHLLIVPAATKQEHSGTISQQYAGALFEQGVLLLSDVIFQQLWCERGESAGSLWKRHANLE